MSKYVTNDAISGLSAYNSELEHPDPETDKADTIPDWWCHSYGALPVLCLSVALQSAAAGTHTHTNTCLWHSAFVTQVRTLLMPERAAFSWFLSQNGAQIAPVSCKAML